ncbi:hypothetical protein, partial [Staphylococcus aureus]|uniref:hypothetical protein n=1 Tax=Staphylococcus aureus TaxID=1280 RepID=UPI003D7073B3
YELDNYEADDIIGTLSKEADKAGFQTIIITGDRDLTQLATDNITLSFEVGLKAFLILRPSSSLTGIFCKLGSTLDKRPVCAK